MRPRSSLRRPLLALTFVAATCGSSVAFADVPVGWTIESTIDGGTSALGASIAATHDAVVVGAPFTALSSGAPPTGAVLVYTSDAGAWAPERVTPSDPIDGGNFGASVAASGNLVAVGAPGTPPTAYVFAAGANGYQAQHTWSDPPSDGNQSFGGSVAVLAGSSGTSWVAVGAPPGSSNPAGVVYVSSQVDGGAWSDPPTVLTNPSAEAFGLAVAFADNGQLLVGDPATGAGQVLVYSALPDGGWEPQGTLPVSFGAGDLGSFGNGIATGDGLVVVTAPDSSNEAGTVNGAAFVFAQDGGAWTQQAVLTAAPAESFGNFTPSITSGLIAIGSAINTASSGTGRVDVWASSGGAWVPVPSASLTGDAYYGQAVGVTGSTLFIGDTTALGAGAIGDVTSSLSIVAAAYGDGGSVGSDGAAPGATPDAATSRPGETDGSASSSGSSGCSCAETGQGPTRPWLFVEGLVALLAWETRRRTRAKRAR